MQIDGIIASDEGVEKVLGQQDEGEAGHDGIVSKGGQGCDAPLSSEDQVGEAQEQQGGVDRKGEHTQVPK